MVDMYGRWYEEADYTIYPEEKLCDYDRMAIWIREQGYVPETCMENLITKIFLHCDESYREDNADGDIEAYKYEVEASGGLREFDYY